MTAQELVDFIEAFDLGDWEIEVKAFGEVIQIVNAVRAEGFVRLYPEESDEPEAEIEIEGGGISWWYACGDCNGAVDEKDRYCRWCGKRLKR